jgi:hypothetical protein
VSTRKPKPGSRWRIKAGGAFTEPLIEMKADTGPVFDELVIDDWFHIEQMDADVWWFRIGEHAGTISVRRKRVVFTEGPHA